MGKLESPVSHPLQHKYLLYLSLTCHLLLYILFHQLLLLHPQVLCPEELGPLPTDTRMFSASTFSPPERVSSNMPLSFLDSSTFVEVYISISFFLKALYITFETSSSSVVSILGRSSTMVTLVPNDANILANSHPTTPPPTIRRDLGSFFSERTPSIIHYPFL